LSGSTFETRKTSLRLPAIASPTERLARLGQFDLFEAIRDENGDLHALQSFAGHDALSFHQGSETMR